MYRIAIIENDENDLNLLQEKLKEYQVKRCNTFNITTFSSAYQFLTYLSG